MNITEHTRNLFKKRLLMLVAASMALMLILAACGDDDSDSNGNGSGEGLPGEDFGRPVKFADLNWDSALFHNRILQFVLEHGYGYETEGVPGGTIAMLQGLINGDVDVATEMTASTSPEYGVALEEGTVEYAGMMFTGTTEGWYVPTYMIEGDEERGIEPMTPDLRHVDDLPEYWEVFQDPEVSDKGRFYGCIPGWQCQIVNEGKFEAYGLNEYYNRFNPGSDTALATSLVTAIENGDPWFGYYWEPTWVMGMVDVTMLEEPEYTDECWEQIRTGEVACAYPMKDNDIATTPSFAESETEAMEFFAEAETNVEIINAALVHMRETDATPEAAALWFFQEYEDVWTEWVPEDVADRVRDALESSE